jgi:DNA topoisomerase-2
MASKNKVYIKKDPISHVLDRSDMYVGSKKLKSINDFVAVKDDNNEFKIIKKTISYSPAILRIFIESLSNAVDNVERSRKQKIPCTAIKIHINKETGETSVWNDGDIIPVEMNESEKMYNHSLIFGNLLTGSNYDDTEERLISGKNGVGIKCTNIFSTKFTVKGLDPKNKKTLEQTWTNNMRNVGEPVIKETKLGKGYTKVTYFPDFKQFELKGYTDDIISLYTKYILDASMLTKVKVYLNDELITVNSLLLYSKLYEANTDEKLVLKTANFEVLVTTNNTSMFEAISFVNGIYTKSGGVHVDETSEALFRNIVKKMNKKDKPQVNISDVKKFFRIFVIATVINPEFSSQEKEKLEAPVIKVEFKASDINKLLKWSVIEEIQDIIKMKEMSVLKKTEKKKKGYTKIEGLDQANNAGGRLGYECSLILCEGLSAKTYAAAGIQKGIGEKEGRNWFGILPLRGKCLNVRNSIPSMIAKNKVITDLIQALGLRYDVDYKDESNYKTLSYGKVVLLTDADVDGIHIEALIMNFFHYLFPSLLERKEPYLVSMKTPIVRVFNPKGDILFYDENKFREYSRNQSKTFKSKYYKGLGTTKPEDVPDTFGLKMVEYDNDNEVNTVINKVFHKKFSDTRKTWLANYNPEPKFSLDNEGKVVKMNMSYFFDNELIKFSINDCKRSIPTLYDGLKESQRKILYAVKKRDLTYKKQSLKVAQLGGYVAEHSNYHHGEQNLYDTIINMAQDFVGSNNIPLLYRDGMFGTRNTGGSDAASARYIFTKMETITPYIFRSEDDVLLEYLEDDGDKIEPKFYIPIIPMILINGSKGIGTGWSSTIPNYNPLDIVECIKIWLEKDGKVLIENEDSTISLLPDIEPWYRGFEGKIEKSENKFISYGILSKDKNKLNVTELPINLWIDSFKNFCEDLLVSKDIKDLKNYSTPSKANFVITETSDGLNCDINNLKLFSYIHTTNMVLFNDKDQLKKYSIDQIINDFCIMRFEFYIKRKKYIVNNYEKELRHIGNKERFITEVVNKSLLIMNVDETDIVEELEKRGYDKESTKEVDDGEDIKNGYNYLLRLPVRSLTANKIKELKNDIESIKTKLDNIRKTSEKQLWLNDLTEFENEYTKWLKNITNNSVKINKPKTVKKKKIV